MKVLVTGAAGFIGLHVAQRLLDDGCEVVGLDSLDDYYDPGLKSARLARLRSMAGFTFVQRDVSNRTATAELFDAGGFDRVIHLAAQAGVRHSLKNPHAYAQSNLVGFVNVLEGCRNTRVRHLVYASSSSVYGGNTKMPFSEGDPVGSAHRRLQPRRHEARLHVRGRYRGRRTPGTRLRAFPVSHPEHRQRGPGSAARLHRRDRGCAADEGDEALAADAARRRAGDLRRCVGADGIDRIQAAEGRSRGRASVRGVVPVVLRPLTPGALPR
jgi:nucleoside-diphosphate-sugar epimerase